MSGPAYKLRSARYSPAIVETVPRLEIETAEAAPDRVPVARLRRDHDPFYYGWRPSREKTADGEDKLRWIPLTYEDLLDPQEDDVVAEDTIHRKVTDGVAGILRRRYRADPTVAVWSNLKILFHIPGLTTGPGPDICVIAGVEDRDRRRRSFRYGHEPGTVRLVIEVVSKSSVKKDYQDLLEIYAPLGVEEYVAIHPLGPYSDGPFQLTGWRLDPHTQQLRPIPPGPKGRISSQTTGLLFGTGPDGWRLAVWDATTGEHLQPPAQEAEQRAEQEAAARRKAEEQKRRAEEEQERQQERAERAEAQARQEAAARRKAGEARQRAEEQAQRAEEQNRKMAAEIERLRARIQEREETDDT